MPTSFLEIVELPNGEFALRRIDDESAPLVKIRFSRETRDMLQENDLAVAKAMITAGIEAVGSMSEGIADIDIDDEDEQGMVQRGNQTLH
ncbi:MAG: hypothetical protein EA349_10200 [Halomonadaceae bacterium]|nr:MAG: hypothetical protein EA349_10200 [Halomonadaceae bacterium]